MLAIMRSLAVGGGLAAITLCLAGPAAAQEGIDGGIQFGPVGSGPGSPRTDRSFVKEWEGNPPPGFPTLSPANIEATRKAIQRYASIVEAGGWPVVPEVSMAAGDTNPAVPLLRQRLLASGDLEAGASTDSATFDSDLEKAVMRFQASNGLTPTGIVDKRTLPALNVPAEARLAQLKKNVPRLQEFASLGTSKYVVVNIPAAQVEAVEGNKVVERYTGVVGKPDRPTPLLRSTITEMNFNPVWRLPPTVINKDLIPRGREMQAAGQSVLEKFHIDAYSNGKKVDPASVDWNSAQPKALTYSQQPGKDNPLGFLKINFASSESVYMHDTPSEGLFGRNFRAASSGCIRIHNIERLAVWLMRDNGGVDEGAIAGLKESGRRLDIRLKKPVSLYFVYVTAWATEDGVVQFRRDLYSRDGAGELATNY
jgi:murein L,D-transpeptidase YcbB/YkuD